VSSGKRATSPCPWAKTGTIPPFCGTTCRRSGVIGIGMGGGRKHWPTRFGRPCASPQDLRRDLLRTGRDGTDRREIDCPKDSPEGVRRSRIKTGSRSSNSGSLPTAPVATVGGPTSSACCFPRPPQLGLTRNGAVPGTKKTTGDGGAMPE
jgi:hypothetical protein